MDNILYESQYYGVCDLGDSLTHHGIKGQKWGIRRTAEQLGHFAKKSYKTVSSSVRSARKNISEKMEERHEKNKEKAIQEGDIKKIKKYASEYTTNQLRDAVDRVSLTKRLAELDKKPKKSVIKILTNAGNTFANAIETGQRIKKLLTPKEDKDPLKEEYENNAKAAAKKAANKAREDTPGTAKEKEKAARKAFSDIYKEMEDGYERDKKDEKRSRRRSNRLARQQLLT